MESLVAIRKTVLEKLSHNDPIKALLDRKSDIQQEGRLSKAYVRYLSEIAHQYAPHSPRVMALGASRCMSTHPELARYLLQHAAEEQNHNEWALQDLQALGIPLKELESARPVPSCSALIGYTYYVAGFGNPIGLFGWMYVLEAVGDDLGSIAAENLKTKLRITEDSLHFVAHHRRYQLGVCDVILGRSMKIGYMQNGKHNKSLSELPMSRQQ